MHLYHVNMVNKPCSDGSNSVKTELPIISVQKARRVLGAFANYMSDDQVKDLIYSLHLLAKEQLMYNGSKYDTKKSITDPS